MCGIVIAEMNGPGVNAEISLKMQKTFKDAMKGCKPFIFYTSIGDAKSYRPADFA